MALRVATPAASNLVIHAALDYQMPLGGAKRSLQEALTIPVMAAKSGALSSPIQNYLRRA